VGGVVAVEVREAAHVVLDAHRIRRPEECREGALPALDADGADGVGARETSVHGETPRMRTHGVSIPTTHLPYQTLVVL
jgi:hypothetical protein